MRFLGKLKQRNEGVGSIIGAVFIILILLSGLTFYATYLNITDHYSETTQSMGNLSWNQNQERIVIKQISLTTNNNLNLTVENQGSVYSHLIWLGLFNKSSDQPENQNYIELDESLNPSETHNIVSNFTVVHNLKYVVQLVTELGNTVQTAFYPASAAQCSLSLTAASPTTYAGNNVTVMLTVTLNDTEIDIVQNITASISVAPTDLVEPVENSPLTVTGLARGDSAFFWWIYNTTSTGTVTFNATYSSAPVGSYALTNVTVLATPGQGGGSNGGSVTVTGVNGTAKYNPSQWNPIGGTLNVSGTVADLATNNSIYAHFSSHYTGSTVDNNHFVDNNSSNVDGSSNIGTHSDFAAMQYGPDAVNDTLTEEPSGWIATPYYPTNYNLLGSTQLASGTLSNLQTDDGVGMTFRSYPTASSSRTLYAHIGTTNIGGTTYYLSRLISGEDVGTTLSAPMSTIGSQTWSKFVYPLTGITSIPAATLTTTYRAWKDADPAIAFDSSSSVETSIAATSISWSHTTGTSDNRLLIVAVGVHVATGTPSTVTNVTYGSTLLTQLTTAMYSTTNPQVRTCIFILTNPSSGTNTIKVTFAASTLYVCGSTTYSGVDQTNPIQTTNTATGSGTTQSVSVVVAGLGRAVFGYLSGHRTTATSAWTITEGTGQNNRWSKITNLYKGRGSDALNVAAGTITLSWTANRAPNWICSAAVINPAPVTGHANIDIVIRKSDNTIRTTIASGVAESIDLISTPSTITGMYQWPEYVVVDQTDYLEIDYGIQVATAASGVNAFLNVDNINLNTVDQTKTSGIMLPSEYAIEVEFSGTSNNQSWTQLTWVIDSSFTTTGVSATFQLYNYSAGTYPTSGDGYMTTSIGTANITKTQTITTNPAQFKESNGNWKIKIKGVVAATSQFDGQIGFLKYEAPRNTYAINSEVQWTNVEYTQTNKWLCIYGGTMATENLRVDVWNGSAWNNLFAALSSGWNNVSVSSYLTSSTFTIRFKDASNDTSQDSWNIDVTLLHLWTSTDQYTAEVEFTGSSKLQNWTSLLWQIQSCWNTENVTVNIQLYNFALGAYVSSGNGYISYVSNNSSNTNELQSKTENLSPNNFKNSTGHWRVKITGVKPTSTQFNMKIDWIDLQTTYSATGETIPYGAWQLYLIKATTISGGPIPYAYVSIYANGTSIAFRNATDKIDIWYNPTSPWLRLDASGTIQLEVKSTASGPSETFILYAVVGSEVGQKTVTQENST